MAVYLYIKKHAVTGLKYFGKTTQDPYVYLGSGSYWKRHINRHGIEHVHTVEVWKFDTQDECSTFALKFSKDNNITESDEWANLCDENGISGGNTGNYRNSGKYIRTDEIKLKNSLSKKGKPLSESHRKKLSTNHADFSGSKHPMYGKKRPGRKWYNDGNCQILVEAGTQPPHYVPGMLRSYSSIS